MNFEQNGSCDQKCYYSNTSSLYNFISTLAHLSRCFSSQNKRPSSRSKLRKLSLSGCRSITSMALQYLIVHAVALQELDLSGCYKIDGETLTSFVQKCPRLKPERLAVSIKIDIE